MVPHALGMNKIRIALEKSNQIKIAEWWSENYIRYSPLERRNGFTFNKIPDAIFWRERNDGTRQKFFLEYERSLKNRARYMELFESYAKREDVINKNVIYICNNEVIQKELLKTESLMLQSMKLIDYHFQFIALDKFFAQYLPSKSVEPELSKVG